MVETKSSAKYKPQTSASPWPGGDFTVRPNNYIINMSTLNSLETGGYGILMTCPIAYKDMSINLGLDTKYFVSTGVLCVLRASGSQLCLRRETYGCVRIRPFWLLGNIENHLKRDDLKKNPNAKLPITSSFVSSFWHCDGCFCGKGYAQQATIHAAATVGQGTLGKCWCPPILFNRSLWSNIPTMNLQWLKKRTLSYA